VIPPEDESTPMMVARRGDAAAERLLSAWGSFAPDWRQRLAARIAAAAGGPEAMDALISGWGRVLADGDRPIPTDALRAAFLAVDGAQRWPDQFLETHPTQAFRDELHRALPWPLPPAAPLDMPEQPL
jgi:hypothetical protein